MNINKYFVYDYITSGYTIHILLSLSLLSILSAIFVIISKNPILSILGLIGLFASISCYLIVVGIGFIGLSYLIVYIGAVSILFLFILMLIDIRISELESNTANSFFLGIIIIIFFYFSFFQSLPASIEISLKNLGLFIINFFFTFKNNDLFYVTGASWDSFLAEMSHITNIGNIMYSNYNM